MRLSLIFLLATGCFYSEPINQRPSAGIQNNTPGTIFRGETVNLQANAIDPDNDIITYQWRAYACTSALADDRTCDTSPFLTGVVEDFEIVVPSMRKDVAVPVQAVLIDLEAQDIYGATARPTQELAIPIDDRAPDLVLRKVSTHDFVVGSHVQLFADVADVDDGPQAVTLAWQVFSPATQPSSELTPLAPPESVTGHRGEAMSFVAHGTGDWDVRVIATDTDGQATVQDFQITINEDLPPCIASSVPLAQAGATLPLFESTVFEVPVVTDDLDVYPPELDDADGGATQFTWTLKTGSGERVPLAIAGNGVTLDPTSFHAGDVLELRVELADRVPREASFAACPDSAATCAINLDDTTCLQRQTWRVEVQ